MILREYEKHFLNDLNERILNFRDGNGTLYLRGRNKVLDVYIPGIGMNCKAFLFFLNTLYRKRTERSSISRNHILALTLLGFNQYIPNNEEKFSYDEEQQIDNAVETILRFKNMNIIKAEAVNLFGFSYGADLLSKIAKKLIDENGITINKMVFSDVNLDRETAFLTGEIARIQQEKENYSDNEKKIEFIKRVLEKNKNNNEKILDNLEYLRSSYMVNWSQMVKSSSSAYNNSHIRVEQIVDFLNNHRNIKTAFFISNRTIGEEENGYMKGIKSIINSISSNFSCKESL